MGTSLTSVLTRKLKLAPVISQADVTGALLSDLFWELDKKCLVAHCSPLPLSPFIFLGDIAWSGISSSNLFRLFLLYYICPPRKLLIRRRYYDVPDFSTWEFVSGQCHQCRRCTDPNGSASCRGVVPLGTIWKKPWGAWRQDNGRVIFAYIWVVMQPCMPKAHMALNEIICICLMSKNKISRVLRLVAANRLLFTTPKEIR